MRPTALTWVSGGVAVAGVASFAVLYTLASNRYGYLESHCTTVRDAACDEARSAGQSQEGAAFIALGIAGVAAAISVVSLFVHPSETPSARSSAPSIATRPWAIAF